MDLLISSDPSICSTVAFTPLRNSVHVVVVVFIYFQSYTKSNALFCCTVFSIYHANWDCLHDYLGDASCEDILKIAAYVDVLCLDWVQGGTDIYIIYHKYLVKLHSFLWFSAACAAVKAHKKLIAHKLIKMTSFITTNRINLGGLLRLDRSVWLTITERPLLKLPILLFLIKKSVSLSGKQRLVTFGKVLIVFLIKINLFCLHYEMVMRFCLLDLIQ